MRKYPTDYRLWAVISGGLFLPAGVALVLAEGTGRPVRVLSGLAWLALACAVVGWIFHAVAVMAGVRLPNRADPTQATDYDDAPPPPPTD